MFCRFGLDEDSRPVAAPVWLKLVCRRPVGGIDQRRQRVDVGAFQLGELAVLQHLARRSRGSAASSSSTSAAVEIALPLPYFDGRGQIQVLEQNLAQLLRRADVERLAGELVDLAR